MLHESYHAFLLTKEIISHHLQVQVLASSEVSLKEVALCKLIVELVIAI